MYQFIKNLFPTKENEKKTQENIEELNDTVEESKEQVETVEQMEFDISLGINQTSGKLNELEAERDKLFKSVDEIEKALKQLSGAGLTEDQTLQKQKLVRALEERVKPAVQIMDKQIDILTRKLFVLYHKRDLLTQKKVSVEYAAEDAQKIPQQQQPSDGVPLDSITSDEFKNKDSNSPTEGNV